MKKFLSVLLAGIFMVSVAIIGTGDAAARYYCGNQCNGKDAYSYRIPNNGIRCASSIKNSKPVATAHPTYVKYNGSIKNTYSYTAITIRVYYSTVCQTLWASVQGVNTNRADSCRLAIDPIAGQTSYRYARNCANTNTTFRSAMINDHAKNYGKAARISFSLTLQQPKMQTLGPISYSFSY